MRKGVQCQKRPNTQPKETYTWPKETYFTLAYLSYHFYQVRAIRADQEHFA